MIHCQILSRKEFFDDIVNSKLNYYKIITDSVSAKVNGDKANVSYSHTLDALAYGARGAWPFKGSMYLEKRNGIWVVCQNKKNSPRSLRHLAMNHLVNRREGISRLS